MKLYWSLNSIPEVQGLPKVQQRQLWKSAVRTSQRTPRVWGGCALFGGSVMIIVVIMMITPHADADRPVA